MGQFFAKNKSSSRFPLQMVIDTSRVVGRYVIENTDSSSMSEVGFCGEGPGSRSVTITPLDSGVRVSVRDSNLAEGRRIEAGLRAIYSSSPFYKIVD